MRDWSAMNLYMTGCGEELGGIGGWVTLIRLYYVI